MQDLKEILNYTHKKRQAVNVRYSRNAFARDLGVSPTALSQYLSGKRSLSPINLRRIEKSLCFPAGYINQIKTNVDHAGTAVQINLDTFSLVAEWQHFAILNLVEIENIKSTLEISHRLGISQEQAHSAIDRLLKLGFLKKNKGVFQRTHFSLDAGTDIPSEALRKHNREKMELAIESLEKTAMEDRDVSSLTLTFDLKKMSQIKNEIKRFKKRIGSLCRPDQASEVYSLNIQFFPLSKKDLKK